MCVIIYKKQDIKLDLDTLISAYSYNPDGVGLAVRINDTWQIVKYLNPSNKDLKDIIKLIKDKEAVIHCRIATSGHIDLNNCHPFLFDDNKKLLFHNGVMYSLNGISKDYNDTRLLCYLLETKKLDIQETLKNLANKTTNKFIYIDDSDDVFFFGDFKEYKGLKCSNLNFIPTPSKEKTVFNNIDNKVINGFNNDFYLFKNDYNNQF